MPLTSKGSKILSSMQGQYGEKKGKSVFYASINKGTITGAERGKASGGQAALEGALAGAEKAAEIRRRQQSDPSKAGGGMISPPWYERMAARRMPYAGFVATSTPGRADAHKTSVPSGSYILPAEHIAALGQGNSLAGANVVKKMFAPGGKFGPKLKIPKFADGGRVHVPILISGGEYHLDPEIVSRVGGGDMKKGHDTLDKWVMETRQKHIARLRSLPKPKAD